MSDVFISYARSTAAQAQAAAQALRARGYSVWLDDELPTHRTYSEVIEEELTLAKAVLVIWSAEAVKSQWVKSEADRGRKDDKLVQMTIDGARLPMPFDQIQCAELAGWAGDTAAPGWNRVLASLAALVGAATGAPTPAAVSPPAPARRHHLSRRVFLVATAALLVVAVAIVFWWKQHDSTSNWGPVSVAVLPFVAMGEEENLRHLGEGIAEEFTNQFAGRRELKVASRTSAFQAHEGMDAVAIARKLDVAYVLEGSVRPNGDLIRLTTQLIRAADGFHVWSETYELPAQGSATEQDKRIEAASLMAFVHMMVDRMTRNARLETESEEAHQYFAAAARAQMLMHFGGTTETWESVIGKLDKALLLDPDFVPALASRVNAYLNWADTGVRWDVAAREARRSLDRAFVKYPELPDLVLSLGGVQMLLELDYTAAEQTIERVRTINPDWLALPQASAMLAMRRGRVRDAMRHWQQAIEREPFNSFPRASYAHMLYLQGDLASAERWADEADRMAPQDESKHLGTIILRIQISMQRGDLEKARTAFEPLWSEYQHSAKRDPRLGFLLARLGHEAEARALVADLSLDAKADPVTIFWLYYGLKEYEHALEWMRRGIDDHNPGFVQYVRLPNAFPEIQDLPGFAAALAHLDSLQRSP